jgi:hypothetical protein
MSNPVVFFDVAAGGSPLGRIEMTVRELDHPVTISLSFRYNKRKNICLWFGCIAKDICVHVYLCALA